MNYLMTLLASALGSCALGSPDGEVPVLTPEVFIETARTDSTAFILDVRRPGEFAEGHLEGAQLLDWLDQPAFIEGIKHFDKKRTYYLYCREREAKQCSCYLYAGRGFPCARYGGRLYALDG